MEHNRIHIIIGNIQYNAYSHVYIYKQPKYQKRKKKSEKIKLKRITPHSTPWMYRLKPVRWTYAPDHARPTIITTFYIFTFI